MAEASAEERIRQLLVEVFPNPLTASQFCQRLNLSKKEVNRILHKRLMIKSLCNKNMTINPPVFTASESLLQQWNQLQRSTVDAPRGRVDRWQELSPLEEEGAVQEERPAERPATAVQRENPPHQPYATNQLLPQQQQQQPANVVGQMMTIQSAYPQPVGTAQQCFIQGQIYPGMPTQAYPVFPPPTVMIQGNPMQNQPWYQPQQIVYQPPSIAVPAQPQQQPRQQPTRKYLLPLKRVPRQQTEQRQPEPRAPVVDAPPQPPIQEEPVPGNFDLSVFPQGLWQHVLFETKELRARSAAVERLMSRNFTPEIPREDTETRTAEQVTNATPEAIGETSLPTDAVKSLNAMGPAPPEFHLAPHERAFSEGAADTQAIQPVTHFSQDSCEKEVEEMLSPNSTGLLSQRV